MPIILKNVVAVQYLFPWGFLLLMMVFSMQKRASHIMKHYLLEALPSSLMLQFSPTYHSLQPDLHFPVFFLHTSPLAQLHFPIHQLPNLPSSQLFLHSRVGFFPGGHSVMYKISHAHIALLFIRLIQSHCILY